MSSFAEKLLNELFSKFKSESSHAGQDDNIELEIRFRDITKDAFESLYTAARDNPQFVNPSIECSINVISENVFEKSSTRDDTQYIRKIVFSGGKVTGDMYLRKTRLIKPIQQTDYLKYSIGLAKETISRKFATAVNALVRFKLRVSFEIVDSGSTNKKWRLDLTAVKHGNLDELGASLKTIKDEFFRPSITPTNFLQELNYDVVSNYEVELEYIGDAAASQPADAEIAKTVFSMISPNYLNELAYQDEIYHVASFIVDSSQLPQFRQPTHRLKQLSNQVIALSKNTYYNEVYPCAGYFITDKADGQRVIISINGNRCRLLFSDSMKEFYTPGDKKHKPGEITIVDAEYVVLQATQQATAHVFDCMVIRDENLSSLGAEQRFKRLEEAAALVNVFFPCVAKKYVQVPRDESAKHLESAINDVWSVEREYKTDGLIFTEPDEPYLQTKNYKWKPFEDTTIDFLAMKCPQKLLGIAPYLKRDGAELYLLFVGINHNMREKLGLGFIPHYKLLFPEQGAQYYPIQFSPSANPLAYLYWHDSNLPPIDRSIVELSRNEANTTWVFSRVRTDRKMEKNYYGNDFRVAELTYLNYIDRFDIGDLYKESSSYFRASAGDIHVAPNKYKRFVISMLLKDNLSHSKWVIDEAAGRGADLHRYQEIGVENALFIDIDSTAIAELIRRKFEFFAIKKRKIRDWFKTAGAESGDPADISSKNTKVVTAYDSTHDVEYDKLISKDSKNLTVHTLVADLKTHYDVLIEKTKQFGLNPGLVDGIVCNFALHYLCDTVEHLRSVLLFNSKMLKVGGLFMFVVMNGKKVFNLLEHTERGKSFDIRENGVLKYSLRKNYGGATLANTGQMISVLLPFSDEMYDEPLCNVDFVIAEAKKLGMEVELNASLLGMMDKFERADKVLFDKLTPDDKKYIDLHSYVTLRKVKDIKTKA